MNTELPQLPTLKQHIALILALLRVSPNREFYKLYGLARQLVSRSDMHKVTNDDIDYFQSNFFSREILGNRSYYYDRTINTGIGPKTMRWFVENHLIPMIELHLMLVRNGIRKQVTIESVENLL
jgi:hypothetical protein